MGAEESLDPRKSKALMDWLDHKSLDSPSSSKRQEDWKSTYDSWEEFSGLVSSKPQSSQTKSMKDSLDRRKLDLPRSASTSDLTRPRSSWSDQDRSDSWTTNVSGLEGIE